MKICRYMIVLLTALLLSASAYADVSIQNDGDSYKIKAKSYEATVDTKDGCLTNLKIDGKEFLMPGISYSRGSYFFKIEDQRTCILPDIQVIDGNTISAKGSEAEIKYAFGDDSMTWTLTNKLPSLPIRFYMAINPNLVVGRVENGRFQDTPLIGPIPVTEWLVDKTKVKIGRSLKVWGPWTSNAQIWEGILDVGETQPVTFSFSSATTEEQRLHRNIQLGHAPDYNGLDLSSPRECMVFQRESRYKGYINICGKSDVKCDSIEYKIAGKPLKGSFKDKWQAASFDAHTGAFNKRIQIPAGGWYDIRVRALLKGKVVALAQVSKFGVGEVFVAAGQSNSTNCGQFRTKQSSGMVSCFTGRDWQIKDDPFLGCHDLTMEGSYYPSFGDAMYAKYHVPVGIASTGHSGTTVDVWDTHGELFDWMMVRIQQLGPGGFRGLLWHQGESDAYLNTPNETYYEKMCKIIRESQRRAGWSFVWFVGEVSYMDAGNSSFPRIRDAQKRLWDEKVALEGADTDKLMGDNRDNGSKGIHMSPKGLKAAGEMWAECVGKYLDSVLDK